LLEKPHLCKDKKRSIFDDKDVYRTIFSYDLESAERFENERLSLVPEKVILRTGSIDYFVEDIIFGLGVYHLTDAFKDLYRQRLDAFLPSERDSDVYRELSENHDFLRLWHYYAVAAFSRIINSIASSNTEKSDLRKRLVGSNINAFWDGTISRKFNLSNSKNNYQILDETNPSSEYPLFAKWISSLSHLMMDVFVKAKSEDNELRSIGFIDHRSTTYAELMTEVNRKIGGPTQVRNDWFPMHS
jgi:hypothetical protein